MTHGTWQIDQQQSCRLKILNFFWHFKNFGDFRQNPYSNIGVRDGNPYSFMYSNVRFPFFLFFCNKRFKTLICLYYIIAGQFAMSHGSYDSNLGSEILILGRDIRLRSWLNICDSYGIWNLNSLFKVRVGWFKIANCNLFWSD